MESVFFSLWTGRTKSYDQFTSSKIVKKSKPTRKRHKTLQDEIIHYQMIIVILLEF